MEEKRIKFGIAMLPSLKKALKARAVDAGRPMWQLTQEALENYLAVESPATPNQGVSTPQNLLLVKIEEWIKLATRSIDEIRASVGQLQTEARHDEET